MENRFQVIIAGCREFDDYELLCKKCDRLFSKRKPTAILSGMARGADILGARYADSRGIPVINYPANWKILGRSAGMVRNAQMLKDADALVAFWDGKTPGTANMVYIAEQAGIPVRVIHWQPKEDTKRERARS